MMGRQTVDQSQLFYLFNLEKRIPERHLLRRITSSRCLTTSPRPALKRRTGDHANVSRKFAMETGSIGRSADSGRHRRT